MNSRRPTQETPAGGKPSGDVAPELHDLLDALPVLVSYVDKDLRYIRVNRTYEEWFGASRQQAIGRRLPDILGEAAYQRLRPHVERALRGERVSFEDCIPYSSGTRWIRAEYLPRIGPFGEPVGFIALISDITQQREAAAAQHRTLEEFRTLAALAPVGIFHTDPAGDCLYVNERWVQIAGMTQEEALGKGWSKALHPEDRDRVFNDWYRAAALGEEFVGEYRFRSPHGRVTWLEGRAAALRDPSGAVRGYLGTISDITERHFAEQRQGFLADAGALLGSSIDYETTLQNIARAAVPQLADWSAVKVGDPAGPTAPMAVFSSDPVIQQKLIEILARYPVKTDGRPGMAQVLKTGKSFFYPEVTDALLGRIAVDAEHLRLLKELRLRSLISVPILVRGALHGAISFGTSANGRTLGRDDLALAEELVRRAAMAIENAEHYRESQDAIRAREEFLSIASHEFRTPLTALLLHLQSLRRSVRKHEDEGRPLDTASVAKPLDIAMAKGQELADMINKLLDVSAMVAGKLKLDRQDGVDLVATARDAAEALKDHLARTGGVLHIEAPVPVVGSWDPVRLDQVMTNLVSNAVKYGEGKDIWVRVWGDERNGWVSVRDQGIGVPPQDFQRIFLPFERAVRSDRYWGWGLGLHISRQIVEAHGGTIKVESEPGRGSTFTVKLPRKT